jgi:hypothetical protein
VITADAHLIWRHYEAAGQAAVLALMITQEYSLSTFCHIIRAQGTVPRAYLHPVHFVSWTGQQKGLAARIIAANPILTLREIIAEATQQGLPGIAHSMIHRYLKVMLVTRKSVQVFHGMRNAQATKNNRILYYSSVPANQHHEWISIYEFGFQTGPQRQFGLAPCGETTGRVTPLTRSVNVFVCLAISGNYELIYWDHWGSACDRDTFAIYMGSFAKEVANRQVANPCYILDN